MSPAPALSSSSSTTVQEFRPKQQAVVVALRTRPFLAPEVEAAGPDGPSSGISVEGRKMSVTVPVKKWNGVVLMPKEYQADYAYGPSASNEAIFEDLVRQQKVIETVLGGGVGLLLAYGQTGSGKTHTIQALKHLASTALFELSAGFAKENFPSSNLPSTEVFEISLSCIEILGSKSRDLLAEEPLNAAVEITEDKHGHIVTSASHHVVDSPSALSALISQASASRATSATKKNDTSSRSHCLVTVSIKNRLFPNLMRGKLMIVDLAGSERAADREDHGRERAEESRMINESLYCLKDCVRSRAQIETRRTKGEFQHVPYRSSKLTMALKAVFDLESTQISKTIIIAHASPHLSDASHSDSTLAYCEPFRVIPTKLVDTSKSPPSTWDNKKLKAWISQNSTKCDAQRMAGDHHTGLSISGLSEDEFVELALASQKPGANLTALAAKKFYLLLWSTTVEAKNAHTPHILASRLVQRDPIAWTCMQVQDWVEKEFGTKVDGELFCPPPWRGKTLLELGEAQFVARVLDAAKEGVEVTDDYALGVRRKMWALKHSSRQAERKEHLKAKAKLSSSVYD